MRTDNRSKKYALAAALVLALLASAAAWGGTAQVSDAETFTVINGDDAGAGSLRDILASASDGDNIVFAANVTTITLLSEISFAIPNITIDGGSGVTITKNETGNFRLLYSTPTTGTLTLKGLTISNGNAASGGGVYAESTVTLVDCAFNNNKATGDGGGVYANGDVWLTGCLFSNNKANNGGGVLAADYIEMEGCTFNDNETIRTGGGAAASDIKMTNCTFTGNKAADGGGAYGEYIEAFNCTFSGNTATGTTAIDIYLYGRGGGAYAENTDLNDCTFTGNTAVHQGGGLYAGDDANLTRCTFDGNTAGSGGGAAIINSTDMKDCRFTGNAAAEDAGGAGASDVRAAGCTFDGNTAGSRGGGALASYYIELDNCAFYGNEASDGAAVFTLGISSYNSILIDCTISENTTSSPVCAAVCFAGPTYIFHCTVTNNSGGGIYAVYNTPVYLYNCIVAGNTLAQIDGAGEFDLSYGNLVEGSGIPGSSPAVLVTYEAVFGTNAFDPAAGTHTVLTDGIAAGTAAAVTADILSDAGFGTGGWLPSLLEKLSKDQKDKPRLSARVTYGAVEVTAAGTGGSGSSLLLIGAIAAVVVIGLAVAAFILLPKIRKP
jgi:predicted outer membrane repeat protein